MKIQEHMKYKFALENSKLEGKTIMSKVEKLKKKR
jgi:hypothetical protein